MQRDRLSGYQEPFSAGLNILQLKSDRIFFVLFHQCCALAHMREPANNRIMNRSEFANEINGAHVQKLSEGFI